MVLTICQCDKSCKQNGRIIILIMIVSLETINLIFSNENNNTKKFCHLLLKVYFLHYLDVIKLMKR